MTDTMILSEAAGDLFAAYAKAQAEMGEVVKGATNPAFKSKYADLASVMGAIMPALSKNGLALIQSPSFDGENVVIETMIAHTSGQWMRSTLRLKPTKFDPQGVGSAITYGRRYAAMALTGVAPEDDDGNAASFQAPERAAKGSGAALAGAMRSAIAICNTIGDLESWKADNADHLDALPTEVANDVVRTWKDRAKAIRAAETSSDAFGAGRAADALEAA